MERGEERGGREWEWYGMHVRVHATMGVRASVNVQPFDLMASKARLARTVSSCTSPPAAWQQVQPVLRSAC